MPQTQEAETRILTGNRFQVEFSDETMDMLNKMILRSHETPSDLLIKALVVYRIALDAKADGHFLGVVNRDGEIQQEITGI